MFGLEITRDLMALSISLLAKSMLALAVVTVAVLALSGAVAVLLA